MTNTTDVIYLVTTPDNYPDFITYLATTLRIRIDDVKIVLACLGVLFLALLICTCMGGYLLGRRGKKTRVVDLNRLAKQQSKMTITTNSLDQRFRPNGSLRGKRPIPMTATGTLLQESQGIYSKTAEPTYIVCADPKNGQVKLQREPVGKSMSNYTKSPSARAKSSVSLYQSIQDVVEQSPGCPVTNTHGRNVSENTIHGNCDQGVSHAVINSTHASPTKQQEALEMKSSPSSYPESDGCNKTSNSTGAAEGKDVNPPRSNGVPNPPERDYKRSGLPEPMARLGSIGNSTGCGDSSVLYQGSLKQQPGSKYRALNMPQRCNTTTSRNVIYEVRYLIFIMLVITIESLILLGCFKSELLILR